MKRKSREDETIHLSFEQEAPLLSDDGSLYREDLLCDDRQHFHIDTIELVETSPCPTAGQPLEEPDDDVITSPFHLPHLPMAT